ncbi:MAG TPA: CpsB/CapC family capsule biosynthesis tyrosine phosphatase [Candidatus Acidoferrales bacterium]|nr:CpsB/CapC family capsule biosynthesis tyrosine phosphatase [Candidatus Acidoferrales bacterium]
MVDIHCHILHSLDDGADSLETSIQMAESAIADGITHIIATPHANSTYPFDPDAIRQRRDELQGHFDGKLVLATGCDFHLSFENIEDLRLNPLKYTLNQKNYLLVEFNDFSIPQAMDQTLHHLQLYGATPIVTHPERNPLIRSNPERLYRWIRQGCYVQVTAQSLLGRFGSQAQLLAEMWLEEGIIHFIASDAHNLTSRQLKLKEAYDKVAEEKGEKVARSLFEENPRAAFDGQPLPYRPELPAELGQAPGATPKRRKRFFFF